MFLYIFFLVLCTRNFVSVASFRRKLGALRSESQVEEKGLIARNRLFKINNLAFP